MNKFAFIFLGQGSQAVGMLDAWGDRPAVTTVVKEASDALNEDIAALIKDGPKEALGLTTNTHIYIDDQPVNEWRFCCHLYPLQAENANL
jgi:[acyl-carrier-protein] S-malonyltransferase